MFVNTIHKFIFSTIAIVLISCSAFAQVNYPVQLSSNLVPPFSGYLADYGTSSNENLNIIALLTDFTKPSYDIKLKIKLTGQGITIQSKSYYFSQSINLSPGTPTQISGNDISNLLNSANLDFQGITRDDYEQRKILPEGYYQICVTAYDFSNPSTIQVSNEACASGFIALGDPPYLNSPICNSSQTIFTPQQVIFQWTPVSLGSPNSAFNTEYEFSLYEVRPAAQNPNNIIQTLPPIFQERTTLSQFTYGITEPPLQAGMQYVWRVRSIDLSGRDLFKNNGYSQACTFTYGSVYSSLDSNATKLKLNAQAITHRLATARWDSLAMFTSYRLEFKKKSSSNWFATPTPFAQTRITDLEPNTEYHARVRGSSSEFTGSWSDVVDFKTPEKPVIVCGQGGVGVSMVNFTPLKNAQNYMIWEVGQFDMVVTQLNSYSSINGTYTGKGKIQLPFLSLNVATTFTNIKVNDMMQVVQGEVHVVTQGIDAWLNNWMANNDEIAYLQYPGNITTISTGGGQIIINGQNFAPSGINTVITSSSGQTYYVSENGVVSMPEGPIESPVHETGSIKDSLAFVVFEEIPFAKYAFDSKEIANKTGGKDFEKLSSGTDNYFVAEKLLQTGEKDVVKAKLHSSIIEIENSSVYFKRTDGTRVPAQKSGASWEISLNGKLQLQHDALYAFAKKKNSADTNDYVIGKIGLVSVDLREEKVILIPVNNYGNNVNASNIESDLNKTYNRYAVTYKVEKQSNLTVNDYDSNNGLSIDRTLLNTSYAGDLRNIISAYKQNNSNIDAAFSYLFLVNKAQDQQVQGYMALNKKFGFIFMASNANVATTIAHEVGHGKFVLEHAFEGGQGNTQNLMDYGGGELLHHMQWVYMHDSKTQEDLLNTLVQDEDAGAYLSQAYFDYFFENNAEWKKIEDDLLAGDQLNCPCCGKLPFSKGMGTGVYQGLKGTVDGIAALFDSETYTSLYKVYTYLNFNPVDNSEEAKNFRSNLTNVLTEAFGQSTNSGNEATNATCKQKGEFIGNMLFGILGTKGLNLLSSAKVTKEVASKIGKSLVAVNNRLKITPIYKKTLNALNTAGTLLGTKIDNAITVLAKNESLPNWIKTSFLDSKYLTAKTNNSVTLYRDFGDQAFMDGSFCTTINNATRNELALHPSFGNNMRFKSTIEVPTGETLNIGKVGPYPPGSPNALPGGADQILLPENYSHTWIKQIIDTQTGEIYNVSQFKQAFPNLIKNL